MSSPIAMFVYNGAVQDDAVLRYAAQAARPPVTVAHPARVGSVASRSSGPSLDEDTAPASPLESVQYLLVLVSTAVYFALGLGMYFASSTSTAPRYGVMFVSVWLVLPAPILLAAFGLRHIHRQRLDGHPLFYPFILIGSAGAQLLVSLLLSLSTQDAANAPDDRALSGMPGALPLALILAAYLIWVPLLVAGTALLLHRRGRGWQAGPVADAITRLAYVMTPLGLAAALIHFAPNQPSLHWAMPTADERRWLFATSLAVGLGATALLASIPALARRPAVAAVIPVTRTRVVRWACTLLVLSTYALVTFDVSLPTDLFHQYSFLVPIHAIQLGRTPLVDLSSGNGILVVFLYSWVFQLFAVPSTAQGLTLVNTFFIIGGFVALYYLLRLVTHSMIAAALGTAAIVWIHYLSAPLQVNWYIQHGPSRFGLPYVYLLMRALRGAYPRYGRLWLVAEHAVIGIASIWMLEAFLYVAVAYATAVAYEAYARAGTWRGIATFLARRAALSVTAIVIAHAMFMALVYARSGQLPEWSQYFIVFGTIVPGQDSLWFGRQIPLWTPWALFMTTYGVSALIIASRALSGRRSLMPVEEEIVLGMTMTGVLQFYFHILNTFPYSLHPVTIPAVFVATYWVHRLWRTRDRLPWALWLTSLFCSSWGVAIVGLSTAPQATVALERARPAEVTKVVVSALTGLESWTADRFAERLHAQPSTSDAADALALIEKYRRPGDTRLGVFLYDGIATSEVLMFAGAVHAFPMDYPSQDALHAIWRRRSVEAPQPLRAGDVVYVDPKTQNYLERRIVRRLCADFDLQPLEAAPSGVTALRLAASHGVGFGLWCARHFAPFVTTGDGSIHAVSGGQRRLIPDDQTYALLSGIKGDPELLVQVSDSDLETIPVGPPIPSAREQKLFVQFTDQLYLLLDDGQLLHMATRPVFESYGGDPGLSNVVRVTDGDERFWARDPVQLQLEVRPNRVYYGLDAVLLPNVPSVVTPR